MTYDQIYKAWQAVGADIAGLKWDDFVKALAEQPAPMSQPNRVIAYSAATKLRELGYEWVDGAWKQPAQPQQDRDYTWPTVADYENDVGFKVNQAFKMAWDMARTTNSFLNQLAGVIPQPAEPQQDPVAWMAESKDGHVRFTNIGQSADELESYGWAVTPLYTSPPAQEFVLTAREIELLDGMIEVQLDHAAQCDNIANRVMAEKQKGWDMERVELLRKLKGDA